MDKSDFNYIQPYYLENLFVFNERDLQNVKNICRLSTLYSLLKKLQIIE